MRSAGRRAEAAEAVLRGVTATRVPERLATLLLELVAGWLGGEGWALVAADEGRGAAWLADRGIPAGRRPLVTAAARTAMSRGEVLWLDGTVVSSRGGRSRACFATLAIPMHSRGRVVAALVGIERRAPGPLPAMDVGNDRLEPLHALRRRDGGRARDGAAPEAGRDAGDHRRPDGPLQPAVPGVDAAARGEARGADGAAALVAVRRPRRVQGDQRPARAPVRQPRAGRGRCARSSRPRARPTWWRATAGTSSR